VIVRFVDIGGIDDHRCLNVCFVDIGGIDDHRCLKYLNKYQIFKFNTYIFTEVPIGIYLFT
jgi:hypothetical protein